MATFQSHVLGLAVSIQKNLQSQLAAARGQWNSFTTGLTQSFNGVGSAMNAAGETGLLTRGLLGVAGVMYTLQKAIAAGTEALYNQQRAMDFLIIATERYGRSMTAVQGAISRLSATGSDLSVTGATSAMGGLLGARWNESQAEELTSGPLRAIAAMTKTAGQSVDQAMSGIVQSMASGSAGAIASAIPYIEQKMQMQWTSMADATNPLKWPLFQQGLLNILRQEGPLLEARYAEFKLTLRYARAQMDAAASNLRLEFGKALEPMLIRLTHAVTAVLEIAAAFMHAHPALVRFGVVLTTVAAGLASVTLAIVGARVAMNKMAATESMLNFVTTNGFYRAKLGEAATLARSKVQITAWADAFRGAMLSSAILIGVFAYAVKSNFMGMGDTWARWSKSLGLIFEALSAGIHTFNGDTYAWSEKLEDALEANGLLGFVKSLMRGFALLKSFASGFVQGFGAGLVPLMAIMKLVMWSIDQIVHLFLLVTDALGFTTSQFDGAIDRAAMLGYVIGGLFAAWVTGIALTGGLSIAPMLAGLASLTTAFAALDVAALPLSVTLGLIAIALTQIAAGSMKVAAGVMAMFHIKGGRELNENADKFFLPSKLGYHGSESDFSYDTPSVTGSSAIAPAVAAAHAPSGSGPMDIFFKQFKDIFRENQKPPVVGVSIGPRVITDTVKENEATRNLLRSGTLAPNGAQ